MSDSLKKPAQCKWIVSLIYDYILTNPLRWYLDREIPIAKGKMILMDGWIDYEGRFGFACGMFVVLRTRFCYSTDISYS